jgi:hypothetical protein
VLTTREQRRRYSEAIAEARKDRNLKIKQALLEKKESNARAKREYWSKMASMYGYTRPPLETRHITFNGLALRSKSEISRGRMREWKPVVLQRREAKKLADAKIAAAREEFRRRRIRIILDLQAKESPAETP